MCIHEVTVAKLEFYYQISTELVLVKQYHFEWAMTRNVMFNFLQNLTTSKKQQQLQASNTTIKSNDCTLFDVSKPQKTVIKSKSKSKSKCEIAVDDGVISKAVNGKSKKKSSTKSKFFLRKSRWVLYQSRIMSRKEREFFPLFFLLIDYGIF